MENSISTNKKLLLFAIAALTIIFLIFIVTGSDDVPTGTQLSSTSEQATYLAQLKENPVSPNTPYSFKAPQLYFKGWSGPEEGHRWSDGYHSSISFVVSPESTVEGNLVLDANYFGQQDVTVRLNGVEIDSSSLSGIQAQTIKFDPQLLRTNDVNVVEFDFPQAKSPQAKDSRIVAMALKEFEIQ